MSVNMSQVATLKTTITQSYLNNAVCHLVVETFRLGCSSEQLCHEAGSHWFDKPPTVISEIWDLSLDYSVLGYTLYNYTHSLNRLCDNSQTESVCITFGKTKKKKKKKETSNSGRWSHNFTQAFRE